MPLAFVVTEVLLSAAALCRMSFCSGGDEPTGAQRVEQVRHGADELAVIVRIIGGVGDQIGDGAASRQQVIFGTPVSMSGRLNTVARRSDAGHSIEIIRQSFEVLIGEPADISE